MNINWKLRLKNKATLTAIISALGLLANQICALLGIDYSIQIKQIIDILMTVLVVLTSVGIVIDPTTQGLNDSDYSHQKSAPSSNDVKVTVDEGLITEESDVTVDVDNEGGVN